MAAGPNLAAKPPLIGNKRNSEAVKDEIPKIDLGVPKNTRRMAAPSGGNYAPSAGGSYVPSVGSYQPPGVGSDTRVKRGSLPGRQAVADPFAKYDNIDKTENDYDPYANMPKP
jgi:hypothetical protein